MLNTLKIQAKVACLCICINMHVYYVCFVGYMTYMSIYIRIMCIKKKKKKKKIGMHCLYVSKYTIYSTFNTYTTTHKRISYP